MRPIARCPYRRSDATGLFVCLKCSTFLMSDLRLVSALGHPVQRFRLSCSGDSRAPRLCAGRLRGYYAALASRSVRPNIWRTAGRSRLRSSYRPPRHFTGIFPATAQMYAVWRDTFAARASSPRRTTSFVLFVCTLAPLVNAKNPQSRLGLLPGGRRTAPRKRSHNGVAGGNDTAGTMYCLT